ncbi:hypothetical protein, partial [Phascolarctobacterium succinatutens]|uniref:hypothetical protein n=1 Tax=Phascolarctobacterium succinatutens TaxID=626940 RepID=UPI00307FBCD1
EWLQNVKDLRASSSKEPAGAVRTALGRAEAGIRSVAAGKRPQQAGQCQKAAPSGTAVLPDEAGFAGGMAAKR